MWRILAAMPEKKALMIGVGGSVIVTTCKFATSATVSRQRLFFSWISFPILTYL